MSPPAPHPDLVSVIIPVFDRAALIADAVRSVLDQTHPEIEIVIIDDGSTDGTAEVVDQLAVAESRITVIHQANRGPSAARNVGVAASTGEWLAFLDSDDLMHPDRITAQLAAVRSAEGPAVCICHEIFEIAEGVTPPPSIRAMMSTPPPHWAPTSMLLSRIVFDSVGGYDETLRLGEDLDLLMRLQRAGVSLIKEPAAVFVRRIFGDNLVYGIESTAHTMLDLMRRQRTTRG